MGKPHQRVSLHTTYSRIIGPDYLVVSIYRAYKSFKLLMCIFNIVSCVLFCHWRKEFWAHYHRPPHPDPPATRQTNKPTPGQGGRTVVGLSAFFLSRTKSPHSSDYYDIADCITFHHTDLHTPRIAHKLWASFLSCTNRDHYCLLIPATRISAPALRPFQAPRCCSSCWWKIFNLQKNFIQKKSTKKYFKKLKNYKKTASNFFYSTNINKSSLVHC